ncbi:MAG: hypothetical protein H7Y38_11045 [Armatimonadetes bacterium]|nr:hypothetical protein [Armatimonadota bacterium]
MNTIYETGFGNSELAQKAKAIYDTEIAPTLTDADLNKFLVIDTDTQYFVLDSDDYQAAVKAVAQNPTGRSRFCVRIGRTTANHAYGTRFGDADR